MVRAEIEDRCAGMVVEECRAALAKYVFHATNEASVQAQVVRALRAQTALEVQVEIAAPRSRFDILVIGHGARVVLELKLQSSAAQVERQVQRYALLLDVNAVVLVTTSARLAAQVAGGGVTIAGKPLEVIVLRTT